MEKSNILAIVGATGLVGSEIINILNERKFPAKQIRLLASKNSAGEVYSVLGEEVVVEILNEESFKDVDIAFFAASSEISEKFAPIAVEAGAWVIDKSSYFRMDPNVPLVVPEVNFSAISSKTKIIASPNCSTIQLVPILKVIHDLVGLKRVVISTYQAVSGAGKDALDELWSQTLAICNQKEVVMEAFPHQIAFNLIPHIDRIQTDGYTKEEQKLIDESRKILGIPNLKITATAVRVPVFHSHSESVNIETNKELSPAALIEALKQAKGVEVFANNTEYPMPIDCAGKDGIYVGRIRKDESVQNGLNLWIVSDNIRKGAALNAVQIAEGLIKI